MEKEDGFGSKTQRVSLSKLSKKNMDTLPVPDINLDLERERALSVAQRPVGELQGFSKQRMHSLR